jgi:hypothetical protein
VDETAALDRTLKSRRAFVHKIKDIPCADCGGRFHPCVMDFDHRPGTVKVANIAAMTNWLRFTDDQIRAEIRKCEVVCSNCHRLRTWNRAHS